MEADSGGLVVAYGVLSILSFFSFLFHSSSSLFSLVSLAQFTLFIFLYKTIQFLHLPLDYFLCFLNTTVGFPIGYAVMQSGGYADIRVCGYAARRYTVIGHMAL